MKNQRERINFTEDRYEYVEPKTIRAAIYARYSTIGNTPYSALEQIIRVRSHLERKLIRSRRYPGAKIVVDEKWVIKDEAESGRVTRAGYEMIKAGIATNQFQILLMDDISRMTRDLGDIIDLYEQLTYKQVEGFSVSDQISTLEPHAKDLFVFKGYANEQQWKKTSEATMRGFEVRALHGYSTGHVPYGYRSHPTKTNIVKGVEKPSHYAITVEHDEAKNVRRIWELFADGYGCRSIATDLNADGIPPPKGKKVHLDKPKHWDEKYVWRILDQSKYLGIWPYHKSKQVKNPDTGKYVQIPRPKSEWIVMKMDDLRVIPIELEEKVKARKEEFRLIRKSAESSHRKIFASTGKPSCSLFTGTMKCFQCGGNFTLISGKSGGYVGCENAFKEKISKCTNKRSVQMSWVEASMVDLIKEQLDTPTAWNYLAKRYNEIRSSVGNEIPRELEAIESQIQTTSKAVENFVSFIAAGNMSETVAAKLKEAETKLLELRSRRDHLKSQVEDRVYVTPHSLRSRVAELSEIMGMQLQEGNRLLKKLFPEKITMTLKGVGSRRYYEASGLLNFFALIKFSQSVNGGR